jgi:uncharacterized membrane protein HdeD (DUF308 family)
MDEKNALMGIIAIILGIVVMIFPYMSIVTLSVLTGIGILVLGIWFLIKTFRVWEDSKAASIAYMILGIIAIVAGIGMMGNIYALSFLSSFIIYLAGFYLLFSGILTLFNGTDTIGKGIGSMGIILGLTYLIIGIFALNPYYLAFLIGIWLIFDGIELFFVRSAEEEIQKLEDELEKESDDKSERKA